MSSIHMLLDIDIRNEIPSWNEEPEPFSENPDGMKKVYEIRDAVSKACILTAPCAANGS